MRRTKSIPVDEQSVDEQSEESQTPVATVKIICGGKAIHGVPPSATEETHVISWACDECHQPRTNSPDGTTNTVCPVCGGKFRSAVVKVHYSVRPQFAVETRIETIGLIGYPITIGSQKTLVAQTFVRWADENEGKVSFTVRPLDISELAAKSIQQFATERMNGIFGK